MSVHSGDICASNGGGEFKWSRMTEERERLWKARHDAYWATMATRPGSKVLFRSTLSVLETKPRSMATEWRNE
jgi:hypothetical protein